MRPFFSIFLWLTLSHTLAYVVTVAIGFPLFTSPYFSGDTAVFDRFMITPQDTERWQWALYLTLPAQILRSFLYSLALYPFLSVYLSWSYWQKTYRLGVLFLFLGFWASPLAAPGSIEGILYLKPFVHLWAHLSVQFENGGHSFLFSALLAYFTRHSSKTL